MSGDAPLSFDIDVTVDALDDTTFAMSINGTPDRVVSADMLDDEAGDH